MEGNIFFELFKYIYMVLIACAWILGVLFILSLPVIIVRALIDGWRGKGSGVLSDGFINFWAAHSED